MQDMLREIFDEYFAGKISSHPMTEEENAVWDEARAVLGADAVDQLLYAQARSLSEGHLDSFRLGFRLGALMMLELV